MPVHINDSSRAPGSTIASTEGHVRLYLASTSPARRALLRSSGIEPVILPSHVDEDELVRIERATREKARAGDLTTGELVQLLARAKAEAVLSPEIDGLVLGGDSNFELDGISYGKPHTAAVATRRIRGLRGRTGTLYSGLWLIDHRGGAPHDAIGGVDHADVTFGEISEDEITAYVGTGEPLEVAGSFTLDGMGAAFITSVRGTPSCVIGMSLPVLRTLAGRLGVPWPSLWSPAFVSAPDAHL